MCPRRGDLLMTFLHRVLALASAFVLTLTLTASAKLPAPEAKLLRFHNAARVEHGLEPLVRAARLRDIAEEHARVMSILGDLEHSGVVPPGCSAWGENVGVGPSVWRLHRAFMASPPHRANILGRFTQVGVGVVRDDGTVWVTVVFCRP